MPTPASQRAGRHVEASGSAPRATRGGTDRVVPESSKKPVRSKPMRGPSAEDAPTSLHDSTRTAHHEQQQQQQNPTALAQAKMKEDVCTQMLMGGYVQSFVDLFYLTHRREPPDTVTATTAATAATVTAGLSSGDLHSATTPGSSDLNSSTVFDVAELAFLRDQLVTAEHCKRKGEIPDVLGAYESLATYCEEKHDVRTMLFFYDKCLEIARLIKDPVCELRLLRKIGSGYHALGDLEKALECQTNHVRIAEVVYAHEDDDALRADAYRQLGRVLVDLAVQREQAQHFDDAIDYYKQYLDCASKASDADNVGRAQFKIGVCYNALAQPANALPFLEGYLTACRTTSDVDGEGNACAELATAHEQLGHKQLSIDFLTHYVAIATQAENVASQADASRRLGHIYTASQDFARAREMHEKTYELIPAVVATTMDATALNCARVNVGAARANDKLAVFLSLVQSDLRGLLEWKNARALPNVE